MQKAFFYVFEWLLKGAQIKLIIFSIIAFLFTFAASFIMPLINGYINTGSLNAAFGGVNPHVWYFINLMNLLGGLSLVISAFVARFLIRRLPFIG